VDFAKDFFSFERSGKNGISAIEAAGNQEQRRVFKLHE
jgi:hypothetical protein